MIVFRRVISVFLTFVLMGTFGACIVIDRVAVEVFDADFIKDELISLDAYEFTTDVLYTQAVDELLPRTSARPSSAQKSRRSRRWSNCWRRSSRRITCSRSRNT